jgi:uncharacterized protein (DUF3084 family)
VEYEKGTLKTERETLKRHQTKYQELKRRLVDQQREVARAVETLYEVERGIEGRLRAEATALAAAVERVKAEREEMVGQQGEEVEEQMLIAMEEIQVAAKN